MVKAAKWALGAALLALGPAAVWAQEDITVTSYYPSPRGVYQELRSINDAYLAYDPADLTSRVLIGTTDPPPGSTAKLYVVGGIDADAFRAFEQSGVYAFLEAGPNDGWAQVGGYNSATNSFAPLYLDGNPLVVNDLTRHGGQVHNVGIHTSQPRRNLEVFGSIVADQKLILPIASCMPPDQNCVIWNLDAGGGTAGDPFRIFTQPTFSTPGTVHLMLTQAGELAVGAAVGNTDGRKLRVIGTNPDRHTAAFEGSNGYGVAIGGADNVPLTGSIHAFNANIASPPGRLQVPLLLNSSGYGNVGIGTVNPTRLLEVNGEMLARNKIRIGAADPFNDDAVFNGPTTTGLRVVDKHIYAGPETANLPNGNSGPNDVWIAAGSCAGCNWGHRDYGVFASGTYAAVAGQSWGWLLGGFATGELGVTHPDFWAGVYGDEGVSDNYYAYAGWFQGDVHIATNTIEGFGLGLGVRDPGFPIHHSSGAHLDATGQWNPASSMALKQNIMPLGLDLARSTLTGLEPVTFRFIAAPDREHAGFIAERVPELASGPGGKTLSTVDIIAILTKVVQDQQERIERLERALEDVSSRP
ncbi:MAG TPA: tail fiber domain-containing protein [Gemmatimonadaceae bacterium]